MIWTCVITNGVASIHTLNTHILNPNLFNEFLDCLWCGINLHILGEWCSQIFSINFLSFVHRMKNVGFIPGS